MNIYRTCRSGIDIHVHLLFELAIILYMEYVETDFTDALIDAICGEDLSDNN